MTPLIALTLLLLATQLGDWYSTRTVILRGTGQEANPVAKWFMSILTMDGFLGLKAIFVTGLGYWMGFTNLWFIGAVILFYFGVLINNYKVLRK